jgi:hypothetical protein
LTRIRKLFLLAILVLVAPVVLAACGDENDDVDPEQVLTETFTNDEMVSSGTLDISASGSVEGDQSGSGEFSLTGAFQGDPEDPAAIPEVDLDASGSVEGESEAGTGSFSVDDAGFTITAENMYVTYQGTTYELGANISEQFRSLVEQAAAQAQAGATGEDDATGAENFDQQCATLIEQAGGDTAACDELDVFSWFELSNEGTEDVEGTDTIHVHGDVDIPAMVDNINAAIEASGIEGATPISEEDATQADDAVTEGSFDVYSGVDDRLLRGLDLNLGLDPSAIPDAESEGVESIDLEFSFRIGGVNEEQTIEAPADAQPIDDLLGQFGLSESDIESALEGYGTQFGLGGLGTTGLGGSTDLGGGGLGGGGGGGGGGAGGGGAISDKYFDCVAESQSANPFKECEKFLE